MAKFCTNCGNELNGSNKCVACGNVLGGNTNSESNTNTTNTENVQTNNNGQVNRKSKIAAGLLGIFLGSFGTHNFYLGYTGKAVAQLLLTLLGWPLCGLGPIVAGVWSFIEGILIISGSINKDASGNLLGE